AMRCYVGPFVQLRIAARCTSPGNSRSAKPPLNTTVKGGRQPAPRRAGGVSRPTGVFLFVTLLAALPPIALVLTSVLDALVQYDPAARIHAAPFRERIV
ncbi:MAG: hypothetical protein V8T86_06165, partial [Victivallis sp.]